ncbi:hypothetical protein [Flammeovirga kamogawensis]|uniref:Uncharacterized protein n=1 Tax=Flammeovirga kamogawensis TaxID=373891 RepID=A0ABX8H3I8_9BACT|nr:hypothetical protein [Flammeovirga kamogawensis]MBB6460318.1 hypothetical protein [Flammeovirga kamogawensis]QWG10127.1 hypothetical protein KM029_20815 [Flammeovirga kamogawensis]TRX65636.1 hypothetical protein EO216_24250 [Flammeovirga kamogawensis]
MKKLFIILIVSIASISATLADVDPYLISRTELESIKGLELNRNDAADMLEKYLNVTTEGNMQYIYNPQNGNIVMYFKDGMKKVKVEDFAVTNQLTNVYFTVNDDIKLHIVMYNNSGKILDVRTRKYDPEWGDYYEVLTEK